MDQGIVDGLRERSKSLQTQLLIGLGHEHARKAARLLVLLSFCLTKYKSEALVELQLLWL
jgi:hypothetical protein